jgi:hypothetical protein
MAQERSMDSMSHGYDKAIELIRECASKDGFLASTTKRDNYHRVWARDGCIIGLAALLTGDEELRDTCRRSSKRLPKIKDRTARSPATWTLLLGGSATAAPPGGSTPTCGS